MAFPRKIRPIRRRREGAALDSTLARWSLGKGPPQKRDSQGKMAVEDAVRARDVPGRNAHAAPSRRRHLRVHSGGGRNGWKSDGTDPDEACKSSKSRQRIGGAG